MVAFRTAALGVQQELGSEIFYGNADALSQVRLLKGNDALVPFELRTVATMSLPAGRWAITAKATVLHPSDAEGALRCFLSAGSESASVAHVAGTDAPGDRSPIALQLLHSAGASSEARLRCQDLSDAGTTGIRDIRLAAYRARAIERRELDPGATFGPTRVVKPVVYAATETEYRAVPRAGRYRTIDRLSLPAGSWLTLAMGMLTRSATGHADVDCRVGRWQLRRRRAATGWHGAIGTEQPFAIAWAGSFGERRTVRFQCRSSEAHAGVYYLSFLSYRVGTLRTMSLR